MYILFLIMTHKIMSAMFFRAGKDRFKGPIYNHVQLVWPARLVDNKLAIEKISEKPAASCM